MHNVITRIAPSPTGLFHIGTARTALFNYLFARKNKGKFIIRIEDTDKSRGEDKYEKDIIQSLKWLGIDYDEISNQSNFLKRHTQLLQKIVDNGKAYISKESKKDNPNECIEVVRFKNPNTTISFNDTLRGKIQFDTTELGDFVIARSINDPLYHFAVVVDDADAKITNIIRGDDHIANTQRQLLLQQALGFETPEYTHIPLIHGANGKKLSKRDGAGSVSELIEKGYLNKAVVNYIAMLGWSPSDDREIFSLQELTDNFSLSQIQKGSAIFDINKLNWYNSHYIKSMQKERFKSYFIPLFNEDNKKIDIILDDLQNKIKTIKEGEESILQKKYDFFFSRPKIDESLLIPKDSDKNSVKNNLKEVIKLLEKLTTWDKENIKDHIWEYATQVGRGKVLWPMRYSLTGMEKSPDPFSVAEGLGKEETLSRITEVINKI